MAITPQAIKDQEFKVKLRGYDVIEVKAYLELIADEFFEMLEQTRQQTEYIDGLLEEKEEQITLRMRIEGDMTTLQRKYDKATEDVASGNVRNTSLLKEIEDLKSQIANLEWEGKEKESLLRSTAELLEGERKEKELMTAKVASMEMQWGEQQKSEIDFKETLLAGQKFSQDMKNRSEEEAAKLLAQAREDAEKLRQETQEEMARYPREIERLKMKRNQVRDDLKKVLVLCLENLDVFDIVPGDEDDGSELFQSVVIAEDGSVDLAELEKFNMELELPEALQTGSAPEPEDEDS
ncbi:MAG: DivIVA domain-containing protein [Desulfocapsaceae bacterium]|nr:DivIVA domain-containing protein [Desulfocapsaceae bacterium]